MTLRVDRKELVAFNLLVIEPIVRLPKVSSSVMNIFSQQVPNGVKDASLNMKAAVLNLKKAWDDSMHVEALIRKEEKSIKFHKAASLLLLAATVACIAVGVLLSVWVFPPLSLCALTAVIPVLSSIILHVKIGAPNGPQGGDNGAVLLSVMLSHLSYIYDAFIRKVPEKKDIQARVGKAMNVVLECHQQLKCILDHEDQIRTAIKDELGDQKISSHRKKVLREAIQKLDQIHWYYRAVKSLPFSNDPYQKAAPQEKAEVAAE